ncbi:putative lipid binding protein [Trypoxylus dichotomus]
MVQIAGTYQHMQTIKPEEILKAAGQEVTPEALGAINDPNSKLVVEANGDNFIFTTTIGDSGYKREIKFTIGKAYDEEFKGAKVASTVVSKDGNKLVFVSTVADKVSKRYYEFNESGVNMVYNPGTTAEAIRKYKIV